MSEPSSVAGSNASLATSSTDPASATAMGVEQAVGGTVSDLSSTKAAAAAVPIQQKYGKERDKRLRPEGLSQYIDLSRSEKFKHFQDDPWIDAPDTGTPALIDGSRCQFLILGAGFGGLVFAVRLMQAGFNVDDIRIVDPAGGFGGTWYWNRYPGLMCDIESYIYMPLLEETGAEVKDLTWDDNEKEWVAKMVQKGTVHENSHLTVRARFAIPTSGLLNSPKLPNLPGIDKFQGHSFHTSRWDYTYTGGSPTDPSLTKLKNKKVAIIGTGATAVQAVPHLGKWAKELYVFQRTPSAVDMRDQRPTDPEWWAREIPGKKGWQRKRNENFAAFLSNASPPPAVDMVGDGWTKMPSYSALIGGPAKVSMESLPAHLGSLHAMDFPRQERVRSRVDEVVKDKATAEKLKAWYPGWCKRPCFHDDYLPTFNLPNVTLVDTDGKGVDSVTEDAVLVGDSEYKVDLLIFSTGFRSPVGDSPAFRAGMSVTGRDGQSLDQKWVEGVSTLHGVSSRGFPNLFLPGLLQAGATVNYMFVLDQLAIHVAYIVSEAARKTAQDQQLRQKFTVEPTAEAEQEWSMQILSRAATFAGLAGCTPGYLNREGEIDRVSGMEERMKAAKRAIWGEGILDYVNVIEGWRHQGNLRGLEITATG